MIRKASYVSIFGLLVAVGGVVGLKYQLPLGPIVLMLTLIPLIGLFLTKRSLVGAIPDLVFGAMDTFFILNPSF